jgi:carbon monoxide dehydrogenase subunit G
MELKDSFTVPVTADRLWEVLTDVELIAPCVPGFQLAEAADPDYRGAMKIKVGAITVQYDATITFVDRDDAARRAVLTVTGREKRGAGSVNAKVTATLTDEGEQTTAEMVTDVQVTGRVAQFGRGIIADVGSRLTGQFVDNLNSQVLAPTASAAPQPPAEGAPPAAATAGADGAAGPADGAVPEPPRPAPAVADAPALDLGATAMGPVLKRVGPAALVLLLAVLVIRRLAAR